MTSNEKLIEALSTGTPSRQRIYNPEAKKDKWVYPTKMDAGRFLFQGRVKFGEDCQLRTDLLEGRRPELRAHLPGTGRRPVRDHLEAGGRGSPGGVTRPALGALRNSS